MTRTPLALACCLLLAAAPASAAPDWGVKVHRIIQQDPVLELVVAVEDAQGQPITDLGLADFDVRLGDAESRLLSARSFVDAGSSNGTYVDGEDIRGHGAVRVGVGQQLQRGLLTTVGESC